jgi:hypothetical protein
MLRERLSVRAIQRIRIAHNEDRISGPQRRALTALRLGKSAAEAPETRVKLAPGPSNNGANEIIASPPEREALQRTNGFI